MKPWLKLCGRCAGWCGQCVLGFLTWTVWLALVVLLVFQLRIAIQKEFSVPASLLRAAEQRLAASQIVGTFGRAIFDPTGSILFEDVRVSTTTLEEPLVTARSVLVRLDPWQLLVGRFEPREMEATGVNCFVPAMFSPSGRSEPLVGELELALRRDGPSLLRIQSFAGSLGPLRLTAHGALHLRSVSGPRAPSLPVAEFLSRNYPALSRRLATLAARLDALDHPELHLELTPSDTRLAFVAAELHARGATLDQPFPLRAGPWRARTAFSLAGPSGALYVDAAFATLASPPHAIAAQHVSLRGRALADDAAWQLQPDSLEAAAARVTAQGRALETPLARARFAGSSLQASLATRFLESPLVADADLDLAARQGRVRAHTEVNSAWLAAIGEQLQHDLGAWIALHRPAALSGELTLEPGWRPAGADGRLDARDVVFHGVPFDRAAAALSWHRDGAIAADDVILQSGEQEARGRYIGDLASHDYRFLLTGRMQPLQISPWFHDWWSHFFSNFEFTGALPSADVDVQGRWGATPLSNVFVFVDADRPRIRSVPFDRAHTRLFVRPDYYDGLELFVTRGPNGDARGTFTRVVNPENGEWQTMDFDVASTVDVADAARIFGPVGEEIVAPFHFAQPPQLSLRGRLTGPGAGPEPHQQVHIAAESPADFSLYKFPLHGVAFEAVLHDHELIIDSFRTGFAGGQARGRAHVTGLGGERRLSFDATLADARLGPLTTALTDFPAHSAPAAAPSSAHLISDPNDVHVNATLAAEGAFDDITSYHGTGHAELSGAELGQLRLFGQLSELLQFTSLRFTAARAHFQINGPELAFDDVSVTGANSAIQAHGTYRLDRKQLDFNARVYPFQESKLFIQSLMGVVLTPLSTVLEVKLTGSLAKPSWAFVVGPTSFLRALKGPQKTPAPEPASPLRR